MNSQLTFWQFFFSSQFFTSLHKRWSVCLCHQNAKPFYAQDKNHLTNYCYVQDLNQAFFEFGLWFCHFCIVDEADFTPSLLYFRHILYTR